MVSKLLSPRSYEVSTPSGYLRRNRQHIRLTGENSQFQKPRSIVQNFKSTEQTADSSEAGASSAVATSPQEGNGFGNAEQWDNTSEACPGSVPRTRSVRQVNKPAWHGNYVF